jgi:hypothetical protein
MAHELLLYSNRSSHGVQLKSGSYGASCEFFITINPETPTAVEIRPGGRMQGKGQHRSENQTQRDANDREETATFPS